MWSVCVGIEIFEKYFIVFYLINIYILRESNVGTWNKNLKIIKIGKLVKIIQLRNVKWLFAEDH